MDWGNIERVLNRAKVLLTELASGAAVPGEIHDRAEPANLPRIPLRSSRLDALLGVEVMFAAIFEPARNALIPNVTRPDELLPANALSSATWSVALMLGAGLGGLVTAAFGRNFSFAMNSSFLSPLGFPFGS